MISILIPIYNFNTVPLIKELHNQCKGLGIEFEIICIDDCSTVYKHENHVIAFLEKCSFHVLHENSGRSKIRNLLAAKASYKWLLFLDCDTFPKDKLFICAYVDQIKLSQSAAIYGGLQYRNIQPENDQMLRWVYGKKREEITVSHRLGQPYKTSLVSNFLIQKSVFATVLFNENNSSYGYEDTLFMQSLEWKGITIDQIENSVFHLNIETSTLFLAKTREAMRTLLSLQQTNTRIETKITTTFKVLNNAKLVALVAKMFSRFAPVLENNLLSKKPSVFVFDLYKIGYFCYLNKK
ncbi:MAG: glycosyltransferase involved in cell wall biosynthesis [Flavobacteriales bacterium]|jgi:glycosyltransferase involved in cell wall biosynthesis